MDDDAVAKHGTSFRGGGLGRSRGIRACWLLSSFCKLSLCSLWIGESGCWIPHPSKERAEIKSSASSGATLTSPVGIASSMIFSAAIDICAGDEGRLSAYMTDGPRLGTVSPPIDNVSSVVVIGLYRRDPGVVPLHDDRLLGQGRKARSATHFMQA